MAACVTCYFRVTGPAKAAQDFGSRLMSRLTDTYGPACGCGVVEPEQVHITVNVPQGPVTYARVVAWFPPETRFGLTVQCKWVALAGPFNYGEWSLQYKNYTASNYGSSDDMIEVEGRKVPHGPFLSFLQEWNLESEYM